LVLVFFLQIASEQKGFPPTLLDILLEGAHEALLLLGSLEATVTELGRGVDELEGDLLEGGGLGVGEEGLPEGENPLLDTNAATLDHEEVLVDNTIVGETSEGGDGLLGEIELGTGVVLDDLAVNGVNALAHAVDLLVDLGPVVETVLTGTGNGVPDPGGMPRSDTGNLPETPVRLPGELAGSPTLGDTLESVSLGDADDIDHLVLGEDLVDGDLLLEVLDSPVDLLRGSASVDLDLHEVGLLLADPDLPHLGVADDTDDGAVLLDALEVALDALLAVSVLLGVLGEGLLLGLVPVLVEATLDLGGEVLSPDGGEGANTAGVQNLTDDANSDDGGSLDDGDGLDDLLLVHPGAGTLEVTDHVGHTSLVAEEGGQVARLGGVIPGEGLDLTARTA